LNKPTANSGAKKFSLMNILNYLSVFIIFSGAFVYPSTSLFEFRGAYIIMFLVLIIWLPLIKDLVFNKLFFVPFFFILILSLYNVYLGYDKIELLLKQVFGICASAFWFYTLIRINNNDVKRLFTVYLNIAFVVASIGLIQEASYLLHFGPGYDYSSFLPYWTFHPTQKLLRINSILPEPAGFCVVMAPALFVSICSLVEKGKYTLSRLKSIIVIVSFILSLSSTGYLGLIIALLLIMCRYRRFRDSVTIIILGVMFLILAFNISVDFRSRVTDSFNILTKRSSLAKVNLSTFALAKNALVACDVFKAKPIIGAGLGSHELSFKKFDLKFSRVEGGADNINMQDAGSLLIRFVSEMGLLGLLLFLVFMKKFYLSSKNNTDGYLWVINNSILVLFIVRLFRVGHYFSDGFFFFFWLYYFTKIMSPKGKLDSV